MMFLNKMIDYALLATDGKIGKSKDFLFDDRWWAVRYILADTGGWLTGQKVLVSPVFIEKIQWKLRMIHVNLTRNQIEKCPGLENDMPVSKEYERRFFDYFAYPYYWTGKSMWGAHPNPTMIEKIHPPFNHSDALKKNENHLLSVKEIKGYSIAALDGDLGHAEDFIINDLNWALEFMVVDTGNWLQGGKKVLLSVKRIQNVSYEKSNISVDLSKERIENSPRYDPAQPVNEKFEKRLYDYYGRPFVADIQQT